jgi:hypothetical protein
MDFSAKTRSSLEPSRLLPAALAQLGLGWWERHLAGDEFALDRAIDVGEALLARASDGEGGLVWVHDIEIPKYDVRPPFLSCLVQGQAASLFSRLDAAAAPGVWRDAAIAAASPLLAETTSELVTQTTFGPVLEEIPSRPRSHVLNGWISALWGVRDVSVAYKHAKAHASYELGMRALSAAIDRYDTGWWTKYSLYPTGLVDLAKPIYHRYHADQLQVLSGLERDSRLHAAARRWRAYDTRVNVLRALGQKALFVAAHQRGWLSIARDDVFAEAP